MCACDARAPQIELTMESTRKLWLRILLLAVVAAAPTAGVKVWTTIGGDGEGQFADGTVANSQFNSPAGVAVGADGNVYVGDYGNNRVRKFTTATSTWSTIGGAESTSGPDGVAVDAVGNVYVADYASNSIRKFTADTSTWSVLGGNGDADFYDGSEEDSLFFEPSGVAVDAGGNLYVADSGNNRIRKFYLVDHRRRYPE